MLRRQNSIYKMATEENWEKSLRSILQETEANISSLKVYFVMVILTTDTTPATSLLSVSYNYIINQRDQKRVRNKSHFVEA